MLLGASWLPFAYLASLTTLTDDPVADYNCLITLAESVQT